MTPSHLVPARGLSPLRCGSDLQPINGWGCAAFFACADVEGAAAATGRNEKEGGGTENVWIGFIRVRGDVAAITYMM